jgi:cation diffusion facilitator family transporter
MAVGFQMLFDCFGVGAELLAHHLNGLSSNIEGGRHAAVGAYTYGYGRIEILSAFANSLLMIFIALFTLQSCLERMFEPPEMASGAAMTMAVMCFLVNLVGLVLYQIYMRQRSGLSTFSSSSSSSRAGKRGQGLLGLSAPSKGKGGAPSSTEYEVLLGRIVTDNLASVAVIFSSWLGQWEEFLVADAAVAAGIALMVLYTSGPTAKNLAQMLLLVAPDKRDQLYKAVQETSTIEGVLDVKEVHFWSFTPGQIVGTLHIRVRSDARESLILQKARQLFDKHQVSNLTIQVEKDDWALRPPLQ